MGNENAKEIDLAQPDGTVHEKCQNGGVNGISLTITANGHTVEVPGKIPVEISEEPPSPEVKADSTEYAVLESQSKPAEAEVQTPDPSVLIEEVLLKEVLPKEVPPKEVPPKEVPPKEERVSLFSKMFKKKTETEKQEEPNKDEQQLSNGNIEEKEENGLTANDGIQVPPEATPGLSDQLESAAYAVLESLSQETEPTEVTVQTPDLTVISEELPAKKGKVSLFNKMFKKKKAPEKETQKEKEEETDTSSTSDHQQQNGEILEEREEADGDLPEPPSAEEVRTAEYVVLESPSEAPVPTPDPSVPGEEAPPREERVSLFSKMFKKKTAPAAEKEKEPEEKEPEEKEPEEKEPEETTDAADQQLESERLQTPDPERAQDEESEPDGGDIAVESQDSPEDENPVMNFFKTLVAPTKTSKKEAAAAEAPKDQPKPPESQPAPATTTTTVAQVCDPPAAPKGMPAPPPPPPEPPRAEPAAKAAKPEEPKPAAKDSPKGKSATSTLSRFFRSKTKHDDPPPSVEEAEAVPDQQEEEAPPPGTDDQTDGHVDTAEEPQAGDAEEQEEKPDASKASTLEAAAKPAPAPAAAQEEKKPQAKKSLLSFFKPKALLDTVSAAVQAASTSGVELLRKSRAAAAEPRAAPAPAAAAAAAAEAGPSKEDAPKAAKSPEAPAEAKPAAAAPSGGEEAAGPPKKMEKRNSITLFFKTLSQRRSSTDAAAQTDAAPAPSAEKTK